MKANTLQFYDAKKVLPLAIDESENTPKVVLYGEDRDRLKWTQAWYDNNKGHWYFPIWTREHGHEDVEIKDVRYWSEFPIVHIPKDE